MAGGGEGEVIPIMFACMEEDDERRKKGILDGVNLLVLGTLFEGGLVTVRAA